MALNNWCQPPRSCDVHSYWPGETLIYIPMSLALSSYMEPPVVGVRMLDLCAECLVCGFGVWGLHLCAGEPLTPWGQGALREEGRRADPPELPRPVRKRSHAHARDSH